MLLSVVLRAVQRIGWQPEGGCVPRMQQRCLALGLGVVLYTSGCQSSQSGPPRVEPNDNRTAAGQLQNGVLTLRLEAREGRWYPDGDSNPNLVLQHFAEAGRALQNPGPLIRVPTGTTIQVSVHNALDSALVLYGLHTRPGTMADTIHVAPRATRELRFPAGEPGTYFYWGSTTGNPVEDRDGIDSQLQGAFIIDPPGGPAHPDRVFVLGAWVGEYDRRAGFTPQLRAINGLSWPGTERLTYTAGDTIDWRWVNPTFSPHPMHLHGFYFDVLSGGTWAADTTFAADVRRHVVTEMPRPGRTFTMRWIPEEPGNWLMHCHVAYHTSFLLSAELSPVNFDPVTVDHVHGMRGMVLGVTIKPGASSVRRAEATTNARNIRLIAQAAPRRFEGELDEMAFVLQEGSSAPAADSVPVPSSLLVLKRNEPVRITIVNKMRAATGVHWHGIEVPAYSDGVPGYSGHGTRLAPAIAPGDSFVAAFTPRRSGTFIYHAHSNETFQINLGLYGGLLVTDSGTYEQEHDRLIIIGAAGPAGTPGARINGSLTPDTLRLKVGTAYRLRLIHIVPDYTTWIALLRGDNPEQWRPLARDGAELPRAAQIIRQSTLLSGPGQTMDFEYTPTGPGLLRLEVEQRGGDWKIELPIRVER
jgi:FtsP/CotA-like multicopper oxidase with cupredoxin domain